jgi:hypothetical protein
MGVKWLDKEKDSGRPWEFYIKEMAKIYATPQHYYSE